MPIGEPVSLVLVFVACLTDMRHHRIPNSLTYTGFVVGTLLILLGQTPMASAILGFSMLFGSSLLVYSLGALGGGDVKLLGALGLLLGFETSFALLFGVWLGALVFWGIAFVRGRKVTCEL
ncbi:MAG: A24 family peptidase, partial [Pseudomonadota bacterium]